MLIPTGIGRTILLVYTIWSESCIIMEVLTGFIVFHLDSGPYFVQGFTGALKCSFDAFISSNFRPNSFPTIFSSENWPIIHGFYSRIGNLAFEAVTLSYVIPVCGLHASTTSNPILEANVGECGSCRSEFTRSNSISNKIVSTFGRLKGLIGYIFKYSLKKRTR